MSTPRSFGMSALGVLGVVFVLCKIFSVAPIADWSWWLVLLPFYLGLAIILGFMVLAFIGMLGLSSAAVLLEAADDWITARRRAKWAKKVAEEDAERERKRASGLTQDELNNLK